LQDPKLLQVFIRQIAQNVGVDRVHVESSLVPFEAQAPQPTPDVHDRDYGQALKASSGLYRGASRALAETRPASSARSRLAEIIC
jgi:hypothetical protein